MSQVELLIKKALSTNSDDEAIACLKQARKRYNGESVPIDAKERRQQESQAEKYQKLSIDLAARLKIAENINKEKFSNFVNESKKQRLMNHEISKSRDAWKAAFHVVVSLVIALSILTAIYMV